jgi:hypothetical protein
MGVLVGGEGEEDDGPGGQLAARGPPTIRNADMFTLRFRDYPKLPKFFRHRNAIVLISPPAE